LTVPRDYSFFIEVVILGKWVYVAAFNLYCSGVIKENVKSAGYWHRLQINKTDWAKKSPLPI